jgi:NAD+ kinase
MRLILVSPICPHILYSRTFVVSDSKNVSVSIVSDENVDAMITLDGQEGFPIRPNDLVNIRAAENSVSFVSVKDLNFYDVLRAKIRSGN